MLMRLILFILFFVPFLSAKAQRQKLQLTNTNHQPLVKASVIGIDADTFLVTDKVGIALLEVGKRYKISFVGYYDTSLKIKPNDTLLILKERIEQLNEVIVKSGKLSKRLDLTYAEKKWKTTFSAVSRSQEVFRFNPKLKTGLFKIAAIDFQIKNYKQLSKNGCIIELRAFYATKTGTVFEVNTNPLLFNLDTVAKHNRIQVFPNSIFLNMQEVDYLLFSLTIPTTIYPKPLFEYYQALKEDINCNALTTSLNTTIDEAIRKLNNKETIYYKNIREFTFSNIYFPKLKIHLNQYAD